MQHSIVSAKLILREMKKKVTTMKSKKLTYSLGMKRGITQIQGIAIIAVLIAVALFGYYYGIILKPVSEHGPTPPPAERLVPIITLHTYGPGIYPERYETCLYLKETWKQLGIETNIRVYPDPWSFSAATSSEPWPWDIAYSGYISRPERLDPDWFLYYLANSANIGDRGYNVAGYNNSVYDAASNGQRSATDIDERREYVYECQNILAKDIVGILPWQNRQIQVYNKETFEGITPALGLGNYNIWTAINAKPLTDRKILRFGVTYGPDSTNPLVSQIWLEPLRMIYDTLTRIDLEGKAIPWAASNIEWLSPTEIKVTLRDGMKFHDGVPVTADDVKFSYDYLKKWQVPVLASSLAPIKEITITDEHTLLFTLEKPYPAIMYTTFQMVYILPKHVWENVVETNNLERPQEWANPKPIGSGPFKWGYWERGAEVFLEANKEYFNAPKNDGQLFVILSDMDAVFLAMKNGVIDYHTDFLSPVRLAEAETVPHLVVTETKDYGFTGFIFNFRKLPGKDYYFRLALAHTFDVDYMINTIWRGHADVGSNGFIQECVTFWHNPNIVKYEYDITKAKQILVDAGYEWDEAGRIYYPESYFPEKEPTQVLYPGEY